MSPPSWGARLQLRVLVLLITILGALAVISHITEVGSAGQRSRVRSCLLMGKFRGEVRRPVRGRVKGTCLRGKYSKDKCFKLKRESLSPGCNLLDLWNPAWYGGPPRELVVYGDSTSQQLFDTLICEMAKHSPAEPVPLPQPPVAAAVNASATGVEAGMACPKLCWRFGSLRVCMVRVPFMTMGERSRPRVCVESASARDVHVFNGGVHINSPASMKSMMASFRQGIANMTAAGRVLPRLVWRETTPQHFLSRGGNFVSKAHVKKTRGCIPRSKVKLDVMRQANYRWRAVSEALRGLAIDVWHVWEILAGRPDLHPSTMDCSHWCDTPQSPLVEISKLLLSDVILRYWTNSSLAL